MKIQKGECYPYLLDWKDYVDENTTVDAHRAWQAEKMRLVLIHKNLNTNPLIIMGLQRVYDKIKFDYDNNLITEDF